MLDLEALGDWLAEQGVSEPVWFGGIPDDTGRARPPDALHALIDTGGLGMTVERAFDRPTVQVLTRAGNAREARAAAGAVHDAIVDAAIPFALAGRRVVDTGRVGGGPTQVGRDDRGRAYYSCNYRLEIAR